MHLHQIKKYNTYPPSGTVVVQVHQGPPVPDPLLPGIDEVPGELRPVAHVIRAAAPVKLPDLIP